MLQSLKKRKPFFFKIKEIIVALFQRIFFIVSKLLGEQPTKGSQDFFKKLTYVFFGTGVAKALLFVMTMLAGRIMGVEAYGDYALIVSVSMFLFLPISFGTLGGIIREIAPAQSFQKKKELLSTAWVALLVSFVIILGIGYLLTNPLSSLFSVSPLLFQLALIYVFVIKLYEFSESALLSLHKQKWWSKSTSFMHIVSFGVFILLVLFDITSLWLLFGTILFLNVGLFFLNIWHIREYIALNCSLWKRYKELLQYGFYALLIATAIALIANIDKLMLNAQYSSVEVGLYQAYFFGSIMIIGVLTGIFVKVFFPTSVLLQDPKGLLKKIEKLIRISILPLLVFLPGLLWVVFYIYNYVFSLSTALLFTLATIVDVAVVFYMVLLRSQDVVAMRHMSYGVFGIFVLNVFLNYLLIPIWSINGAISASIVSYAFFVIYLRIQLSRLGGATTK